MTVTVFDCRPGCFLYWSCPPPSHQKNPPKTAGFIYFVQLCQKLCSNHMQVKNSTETLEYLENPKSEQKKQSNEAMKSNGDCCAVSGPQQWCFYWYIAKIKENLTCQIFTKFLCYSSIISTKVKSYLEKKGAAAVQAELVFAVVTGYIVESEKSLFRPILKWCLLAPFSCQSVDTSIHIVMVTNLFHTLHTWGWSRSCWWTTANVCRPGTKSYLQNVFSKLFNPQAALRINKSSTGNSSRDWIGPTCRVLGSFIN